MKIIFPFQIRWVGGTPTFAARFSQALKQAGLTMTDRFAFDADVLFVMADCSLILALSAKLFGKRIIQRLDGVYHRGTPFGPWYWLYNLKMKVIHNYLADMVIYQSEYSRRSCEIFLGKRSKDWVIIYNGVSIEPRPVTTRPLRPNKPVKLLAFATFRRRDQIEPIVEAVKLLDPEQFTLDIYGSHTLSLEPIFKSLPLHIVHKGELPNLKLLARLHEYDVFLFADQSACPNAVIEAEAAGLPVVAYDRGSIPELVEGGVTGEIVPLQKHDPFVENYPFTAAAYVAMGEKIKTVVAKLPDYSLAAKKQAKERFSLDDMVSSYLKVIEAYE